MKSHHFSDYFFIPNILYVTVSFLDLTQFFKKYDKVMALG